MSGFRKNLWESLKNRIFRREYVAENVRSGIAFQIKAMRNARKLSQSDLARLTGKAQSAIARLEDPDYGKFSLQTLLEIADAFDVWLSVEFVSFSEGLRRTENRTSLALNAISFGDDRPGSSGALTTWTPMRILFKLPPQTQSSGNPFEVFTGGLDSDWMNEQSKFTSRPRFPTADWKVKFPQSQEMNAQPQEMHFHG